MVVRGGLSADRSLYSGCPSAAGSYSMSDSSLSESIARRRRWGGKGGVDDDDDGGGSRGDVTA